MFILLFNSSQTLLLNQITTVKRFEQHKSIISFIHLGYPAATVRSPRVKRKVRPKVLKIHSHNKNYYTSQTSTESNSPPPPRSSSSPTTSSSTTSSSSMTSPQKLYKQLSPRGSSPRTPRSPRMVSIQVSICKYNIYEVVFVRQLVNDDKCHVTRNIFCTHQVSYISNQ